MVHYERSLQKVLSTFFVIFWWTCFLQLCMYIVGPNIPFCIEVVFSRKGDSRIRYVRERDYLHIVWYDIASYRPIVATLCLFGLFLLPIQTSPQLLTCSSNLWNILLLVFVLFLHNPTCSLFIVKHLVWKRYKIYEFKQL